MTNPTLVFITDRNDLDDQLFGEAFAPAHDFLPETPTQASGRDHLRKLLKRNSGGIIFTTLQKFLPDRDNTTPPPLSTRRNIIVIADEAHRSHYGFAETLNSDGTIKSGLAQHLRDVLPGATFLGFTGTPIERQDRSTHAVFGDYVDTYDIARSVKDGATVPIYYEQRPFTIDSDEDELRELDNLFDEYSSIDPDESERAKTKYSSLETLLTTPKRLDAIARDIVTDWEKRRADMAGKAMIVTMNRHIAVDMYNRIVALRPKWHSDNLKKGRIKVIISSSASDPSEFQDHRHTKDELRELKLRAKNPDDELEIVIVCDMWLTGFDAPCMHTMYVDKHMQGVQLMQAIARVNRTFKDKPAGLVIDYIGLSSALEDAMSEYSSSDRKTAGVPIDVYIAIMQKNHADICDMLKELSFTSSPTLSTQERLAQCGMLVDFVLSDPELTKRYNNTALALHKAFCVVASRPEAQEIRDDVRLFTDVRAIVVKLLNCHDEKKGAGNTLDTVLGPKLNNALLVDQITDGTQWDWSELSSISLASEEFLGSLSQAGTPNLQWARLYRWLAKESHDIGSTHPQLERQFSDKLRQAINRYNNRLLSREEILTELLKVGEEMLHHKERAEELGLSDEEIALYDIIVKADLKGDLSAKNDPEIMDMGDDTLKTIARDLVRTIRKSATLDWKIKNTVQAKMRSDIKKLLRKYGYPLEKVRNIADFIFEQAMRWDDGWNDVA